MRLNHDEWLDALTTPPNYDIDDFSIARIALIPRTESDDVEPPVNAIRIEATHNGTGLDVIMTLRIPDSLVPFFTESMIALWKRLDS